jgi:hypothetical protein
MSSTSADDAMIRVRRPAIGRWGERRALARWQVGLIVLAATALTVYGLSALAVSREHWPNAWMGDAMRFDVLVNLAAAGTIATGLILGLPIVVLAGGAPAFWAAVQQGSSVGWVPSTILPWALSLTAGAMLVVAGHLGREFVALTVGGLVVFTVALVQARAWASIDLAIAAFGTMLLWAMLDLAWRAIRRTPLP